MQARIRKSNEIVSVELIGKIDYESLDGFIELCKRELRGKHIVFNFEALCFVGSCGVTNFLQILASLQRTNTKSVKYVGMAKEFVKLYETMEETKLVPLQIYHSEFEALKSFEPAPVNNEERLLTAPHDLNVKNLES